MLLLLLSGTNFSVAPSIDLDFDDLSIYQDDLGNYVESQDVGLYVYQNASATMISIEEWLQWGLAQFGSTGILGEAETFATSIQLYVKKGN